MSRNKTLLLLPLMIAIAGWLYWQQHQKIYEDRGRLEVFQEDGAVVLRWHASIRVPMVVRFREAFEEWRGRTNEFVIDLDSRGGALREGSRVIALINTMKETHRVTTVVTAGNDCLSMCVPIYLQGERRVAAETSNWMFHEPRAYDFFDGTESNQPEFERRYLNDRFFDKYFTNSVIEPRWRERLREEWVGKDVWKTGKELWDENSNIITRLTR